MRATLLELRRSTGKIMDAVERNETVTITRRGRVVAHIVPAKSKQPFDMTKQSAFGMWKDREDMKDPVEYVRQIRKSRYHDLRH